MTDKKSLFPIWILVATALLLAIVGVVWLAMLGNRDRDAGGREVRAFENRFEKSVRAAAYLENIQYDLAEKAYAELQGLAPGEMAYVRNAAIAALANVKYHMDLAQDQKNDVDKIREALPGLFDGAAEAIKKYQELRPDDPIAYQLEVLRDARWISVLSAANPIIADEEQARLLEKLRGYVARFPENAFLVTQFNNSAEVMSAVEPNVLEETIAPLRRVVQAQPRNIYLLCLLIQRLVQAKDPSALEWVNPLADLLQPFEWKWQMERRPKDLSDLRRAVEVGKNNLDEALGILIGWVGEAKFTEGSLVDAKSIDVSELAFLDLSDLAQMLERRSPPVAQLPPPRIRATHVDLGEARGLRWFDWDVDTVPELLVWTERQLRLGAITKESAWHELALLEFPFDIDGVIAVDLFAVDTHRGTSARGEVDPNDRQAQWTASMRHETIRDLMVYGGDGVAVVSLQPPFEAQPHWKIVEDDLGLSDLRQVERVLPIDWESDGDLDLAILAAGKIELRENRGNRQFRDVNALSPMPETVSRVTSLAVVDFDRDVDLDILVAHADGFGVLENIQHGQFRYRELGEGWRSLAGCHSLALGDFDNNYSWDLAGSLSGDRSGGVSLVTTITEPGRNVSAPSAMTLGNSSVVALAADWNNDAKLDLIVQSDDRVSVWLNRGGKAFQEVACPSLDEIEPGLAPFPSATGNDSASAATAAHRLAIADADANGWLDVAAVVGGHAILYSLEPDPENHFLVYRVKGISDANGGGRNNQYAVGSTVEVFGPFGYQVRIIEDDCVHFGMGPAAAYSLRLIFVNGLTQGVIDPKNDSILEEKQVLIGSCPFLYGWNGERWEMITDLLWNAPLGLQVAKGRVLPDRRWEYLTIAGERMRPHEGAYELRITEELWETAYFDHVALMAVDHPAVVEIHSNEKVGPPAIAEPKLWAFQDTRLPVSVVDSHGRDWLEESMRIDGAYAIPFQTQRKQGLVEPSWLEIDFGSIDPERPAQLILTGWIYPTDTSLNIGIDQNPGLDPPVPPQLWTVGASGDFELANPFIGFPGGKPKTIVVPLDGVFSAQDSRSPDSPRPDYRVRIAHSSQIFWDCIRLGYGQDIGIERSSTEARFGSASDLVQAQWLPLRSAELRERGFSREMPRRWFEPHWYDYQRVSTEPAWPPLRGLFTSCGDVVASIGADDDGLVVMGPGDEMVLRFSIPDQPPPEGWVRDFVLHSVGWDKDAAMNTLEGQSSLPLPFSTMEQYPPGRNDREAAREIERRHLETVNRRPSPARFWRFAPTPSEGSSADGN